MRRPGKHRRHHQFHTTHPEGRIQRQAARSVLIINQRMQWCAERALMLAGEAQDRLRARIEAGGAALESRGREGSDGDDVAAADGDGMDTDDDDLGEDNDGAQVVIPETDKDA